MRKGALSNLSVAYLPMDILSQFINNVSEKGLSPSHIKESETPMGLI